MRHSNDAENLGDPGQSRLRHVYVVTPNTQSREDLVALCRQAGYATQGFTTPGEFSRSRKQLQRPCCVLSELCPEIGRSDYTDQLSRLLVTLDDGAVLFLSESIDVETAVELMKSGAFSVLKKPCSNSRLLTEITAAVSADVAKHERCVRLRRLRESHEALNEREAQILGLILNGLPNKSIAKKLDFSVRSIENYRSRIYNKYGVSTPAELGVKATELKLLQKGLRHTPSVSHQRRNLIHHVDLDASTLDAPTKS